jgi:predicted double-glycine peptidase
VGAIVVVAGFVPETIETVAKKGLDTIPQTFAPVSGVSFVAGVISQASEDDDESDDGASGDHEKERNESLKQDSAQRPVPFYSQFSDISSPQWQKVGCGIASLAMMIEYYEPKQVSVDGLLEEGIASHAYLDDAGWTHAGLINLSQRYGLTGESHSLQGETMDTAFAALEEELEEGPVMASVHYTFDPQSPIPHLVVVSSVHDGRVYYNDPAEQRGNGSISIAKFQSAWKKRYIDIRPIS